MFMKAHEEMRAFLAIKLKISCSVKHRRSGLLSEQHKCIAGRRPCTIIAGCWKQGYSMWLYPWEC